MTNKNINMKKKEERWGFTLIELLIVVGIIGTLASVVTSKLSDAKQSARDSLRISQLREIKTALSLYHSEYGEYPNTASPQNSTDSPGAWIPGLVASGLMSNLPNDPLNTGTNPLNTNEYTYQYFSGPDVNYQKYRLLTQLENAGNRNTCDNRCWTFLTDNTGKTGQDMCGASSANCSGSNSFSPYVYSASPK